MRPCVRNKKEIKIEKRNHRIRKNTLTGKFMVERQFSTYWEVLYDESDDSIIGGMTVSGKILKFRDDFNTVKEALIFLKKIGINRTTIVQG